MESAQIDFHFALRELAFRSTGPIVLDLFHGFFSVKKELMHILYFAARASPRFTDGYRKPQPAR